MDSRTLQQLIEKTASYRTEMINFQKKLTKDDFIIIPDAGNEDGTMIEVAEKSIVWLKITTKGIQCHASSPENGVNAFRAASSLVVKLSSLYDIYSSSDDIFDPPTSTFEPTKKEANVPNINTIPAATQLTPDDAPVVKALQQAILELRGKEAKPMGIGGGTVASYFRKRGFNAAVWSTMDETCHQPNEYCKISNMVEDAKVFAHVFLQNS